jgi:hypothetical protein
MRSRSLVCVVLLSLVAVACVSTWREDSTAAALPCGANEIVVSDRTAGSLTNTWHAECRGKVYQCSVPATADPDTPPHCEETGLAPTTTSSAPKPALPSPSAPPVAPVAPAAPIPAAAPTAPSAPSDLENKLQILKRAHDQGLITDAEYESKRRALLDAF